jgi:hypothetical protein
MTVARNTLSRRPPSCEKYGSDTHCVLRHEIVVEGKDGAQYVFFYTFRGILDSYSGFLYVSKGGAPTGYSYLGEEKFTQITPLEENWYHVSHH